MNLSDHVTLKLLVEHLETQYRLYREEVRMYLGFAVASISLFLFVFIGEMTLIKDNAKLIFIVPLSALSYGALLGLIYVYVATAAHYSALLESKMNTLLQSQIFMYENYYVGPKPGRGEISPFVFLFLLIGIMPLSITFYGLRRLYFQSNIPAWVYNIIFTMVVFGFPLILFSIYKTVVVKKNMNTKFIEEWEKMYWEQLNGSQAE